MIRIYLVRHGIAVDHEDRGNLDDDDRPLTGKGRRRFRRTARAFARLGEPLDFIFTSPLARAVQTAEILAGALKQDEVGVLAELRDAGTTILLVDQMIDLALSVADRGYVLKNGRIAPAHITVDTCGKKFFPTPP